MMHRIWTLVLAIVIAAAAGCHGALPSAAQSSAPQAGAPLAVTPAAGPPAVQQPAKTVVGLQAFFDDASEAAIKTSWDLAIATKGMECAGADGMRPHMTFGSWQVTPDELQQAIEKARALQGRIPGRVVALQPLVREQQGGGLSFSYRPAADPDTALADYHRMVHEQLAYTFETFRPIDLPGQFRPHVTMFSGNAEAREQTEKAVELAKQVKEVRIASFGLVIFGPPRTLYEVKCAPEGAE